MGSQNLFKEKIFHLFWKILKVYFNVILTWNRVQFYEEYFVLLQIMVIVIEDWMSVLLRALCDREFI